MAEETLALKLTEHVVGKKKLAYWEAIQADPDRPAVVASSPPVVRSLRAPTLPGVEEGAKPSVARFEFETRLRTVHRELVQQLTDRGWEPAGTDDEGRVVEMERRGS